jgi:4-amino-4-deoxy-L-arabinose transferase-like glycosyltransferase
MLNGGTGDARPVPRGEVLFARPDGVPNARGWLLLAAILALAGLLRTVCSAMVPSQLVSDYMEYWTLATNLHAGHGLVNTEGRLSAFMSLGYPIFLAAVFEVAGHSIAAVKAANVLLGVASVLLLFLLARRLFGSFAVAAASALLLAVYVEAIAYTTYVAKENLMAPLMISLLWIAADRSEARNAWANPVGIGVVAGLIAMVGNAALSLVPAALFLVWMGQRRFSGTARYLLIAGVVGTLTVAPLLVRNHAVFGAWVLNTNGGFNLYIGNNPTATPYFTSIAATPIAPQWEELRSELGEHGIDTHLRRLAVDHILSDPAGTTMLMLRKAVAFWDLPTHAGVGGEGKLVSFLRLVWLVQFIAACALCVASLALFRRHPPGVATLVLAIAGYTAVHMLFYVIYRYRLPIMPFVLVGAGLALGSVLQERMAARGSGSGSGGNPADGNRPAVFPAPAPAADAMLLSASRDGAAT